MKETTLVILAAGIGSRFGGGIKQLAPVGPSGEIIMDYSIYDALKAGFNKIVFIIRKDIEEDFRRIIGDRISEIADVSYAFQDLSALPDGFFRSGRPHQTMGHRPGSSVLQGRDRHTVCCHQCRRLLWKRRF